MTSSVDSVSSNIYNQMRDDLQKIWIRENLKVGEGFVVVDVVGDKVQTFYMPLDAAKKELIEILNKSCEKPIGSEGYRHFLINIGDVSNIYEEKHVKLS